MSEFKYKIFLDIEKDASNWWDACNSFSHGMNWKNRVDPKITSQITGKTFEAAMVFLLPYLEKIHIMESAAITSCGDEIGQAFDANFQEACLRLKAQTGQPLYRRNYKIFLTTFPRGPYNLLIGAFWFYIHWHDCIQAFLHEAQHFQFIHYWRNADTAVHELPWRQFEFLKESLTVVLDEDFIDIAGAVDEGYPIHQDYRKVLHKQWVIDKNFDRLVDYGLGILDEYYRKE